MLDHLAIQEVKLHIVIYLSGMILNFEYFFFITLVGRKLYSFIQLGKTNKQTNEKQELFLLKRHCN